MNKPDPKAVWEALLEGNRRWAAGTPLHPNQEHDRRVEMTRGQSPRVCVFTCGDSRVPAEILFDAGLGDIFVVRTAGEVMDAGVMASLEFAVTSLKVEVMVVLGHESCGAVAAAEKALGGDDIPTGHLRTLIEQIAPSILEARTKDKHESADFERYHAEATARKIMYSSPAIQQAVDEGRTAIVAARYRLADGQVETVNSFGI